jgi:hypothetical protein
MNRFWIGWVVVAIAAGHGFGQTIETANSDRSQIMHLRTALNHLTVIEVGEPVVQVAAGSPSFKVEWRENKVFVQPTEADVSTNLFIWTSSQRLNYELEAAGAVSHMDFAIDQAAHQPVHSRTASTTPPQPSQTAILLAGKPVRMESSKHSKKPVEILIRDLYEKDDRLVIRYAIRNQGKQPYRVKTPVVYALDGAWYPRSLYNLVDSQLRDKEAARLRVKNQKSVPVVEAELQSSRLEPGQETVGIVALHVPSKAEPTVLQLQFPSSGNEPIAAYLVR